MIVLLLLFGIIDFMMGIFMIPEDIHSFRVAHPYYHHDLMPEQKVRTTWDNQLYYTFYTNSLGFRDDACRKVELHPEKKRILFIGDSHTEGVGVEYPDTFAGLIDQWYSRDGVEVLNASAVSYSPKLYFYKIKYLIEQKGLGFDELVVCIDISDVQNELVYQDFEPQIQSAWQKAFCDVCRFWKKHSFSCHAISGILERQKLDHFYKLARRDVKNPKTDLYATFFDQFYDSELLAREEFHNIAYWYLDKMTFERWDREGFILEKWYMTRLADLCKEHGIKMHVCVYPWPLQLLKGDFNSIQVQFWELFCEQNDVHFINLFPVFFGRLPEEDVIKNYYLQGDVHFNSKGHKLVAKIIYEQLNALK